MTFKDRRKSRPIPGVFSSRGRNDYFEQIGISYYRK